MNTKKKMSNKSIRGVIWHDIERGFYADRFRYLIAVLMLAGVLIILGNHEFGMMDTIFFIQGGYDPVLIIKEGKIVFPFVWMLQVWQSVAVCLVVYIVVYVAGMIGFNKKDILVRED